MLADFLLPVGPMSSSSCHRVLGRLLFAIGAGSIATACGGQAGGEDVDTDNDTQQGAGGSSAVTPAQSCARPTRFCLSPQAMQNMAHTGYNQIEMDPPRSDSEVATGFEANGCLRHDWVASSCCNRALGPGQRDGDQCCYQACDGACCGRALVIDSRALVSAPEQRSDWLVSDAALTGVSHAPRPALTPAERACLVELWQADALMEHASIASFARFALQLLALGAPARLVREAQSAGLDEVRHAERAFSIASRLAGRVIGPGKLPELDAPLEIELFAVARAALVEGCIGETLAAVVALEQAQQAGDAAIRAALLQVAEDETRHAELAFRFLGWALAQGGPELREALRREVEHRLPQLPEPPSTSALRESTLHHYGRLSADEQHALLRQARGQILRPAFAVLLDASPARRVEAQLLA